jgi:drug/metabolite transporter (DMT)-like permease
MIAISLALLSAVCYGASDFGGGLASRRQHFAAVNLVGQVVASLAILAVLPLAGGTFSLPACGWGALAGLGSGLGTLALYRGLANGQMSVVAPVSAGVAAIVPVLVGFLLGNHPSAIADIGVLVALPAVVLISMTGAKTGGTVSASVRDGVLAGIGFAVLFIALSRSGDDAGLWPSAASATTSCVLIAAFATPTLMRSRCWRWPRRDVTTSMLAGLLGAGGTTTFMLASRAGMLAIVSVIASLYPAITVLLARGVLHETIGRLQVVGLTLAAAGVTLIATG